MIIIKTKTKSTLEPLLAELLGALFSAFVVVAKEKGGTTMLDRVLHPLPTLPKLHLEWIQIPRVGINSIASSRS